MERKKVWVVVGASGGIGSAFGRLVSAQAPADEVIATASSTERLVGVDWAWASQPLDLRNEASIQAFAEWCDRQASHVDRLIVASGVLTQDEHRPEKRISEARLDQLQSANLVNATGPVLLTAALEPLLKRAEQPRVVYLSAQVGSIGDNHLGGWIGYRMSKAALNMGVRTVAIELGRWRNQPLVAAVHPGTTATELSRRYVARRPVPPRSAEETAARLWRFVDSMSEEHHGGFFTLEGQPLPW